MQVLYEDDVVQVLVPEKPAVAGHLIVDVKNREGLFDELDDEIIEHAFYTASYTATAVFELLGAQGTNIILNNGLIFGDEVPCGIHVVPRKFDDGLDFMWTPKQLSQGDMDAIRDKLKSDINVAASRVSVQEENTDKIITHKETPIDIPRGKKKDEVDYLIKHLKDRMP